MMHPGNTRARFWMGSGRKASLGLGEEPPSSQTHPPKLDHLLSMQSPRPDSPLSRRGPGGPSAALESKTVTRPTLVSFRQELAG